VYSHCCSAAGSILFAHVDRANFQICAPHNEKWQSSEVCGFNISVIINLQEGTDKLTVVVKEDNEQFAIVPNRPLCQDSQVRSPHQEAVSQ
jgi:hypothetical protein